METWKREHYVNQIISGTEIYNINNKTYIIKEPSVFNKYESTNIFNQTLEDGKKDGLYSENEMFSFMIQNGLWSTEENEKLERMSDEIPEIKVQIFQLNLQINERMVMKQALKETKEEIERLTYKKYFYHYLTYQGLANAAKHKFIIGCSIFLPNDQPYWKNIKYWGKSDLIIDDLILLISTSRLSENDQREIARNEPWRSIWNSSKHSGNGVFGKSAIDLTDYQKNIIQFSQMYDNIYEHGELSDDIINDDDMLDGWMILKKREREAESTKGLVESKIAGNSKIANGEEVFIPVNSDKEAKIVFETNDFAGKVAFDQRMKQIKAQGKVEDMDLIDNKKHYQMMANQFLAEKGKQNGL